MIFLKKYFLFSLLFLITGVMLLAQPVEKPANPEEPTEPVPPWMKPRELSSFQTLLQHSPFSLATAEDSSPLSERYLLTGVITLGGEEEAFIMDRNDQSRDILTKKPNSKGMALVNIIHDDDPNKLKATIRVNGETGVINNNDSTDNNGKGSKPGAPNAPYNRNGNHLPVTPRYPDTYPGSSHSSLPQQPGIPPSNSNNYRVIRRPPISVPPSNQNYQQGMPNSYPPPAGNMYPNTQSYPPNNYQQSPPGNDPHRMPINNYHYATPPY